MSKASKKSNAPGKQPVKHDFAFTRDNYRWMIIGLAVIIIGFVLMYGKTDDLFNSGQAFEPGHISASTHIKITLAPIIVLLGFAIEVYAIMKRPAKTQDDVD